MLSGWLTTRCRNGFLRRRVSISTTTQFFVAISSHVLNRIFFKGASTKKMPVHFDARSNIATRIGQSDANKPPFYTYESSTVAVAFSLAGVFRVERKGCYERLSSDM